jgi:hypothetical protein
MGGGTGGIKGGEEGERGVGVEGKMHRLSDVAEGTV